MKRRIFTALLAILFLLVLLSCSAVKKDDPLKHTKKLVKEGHASLYNNGAFKVPKTSISLIPPGPDALKLAGELAGIRAKESFLKSIKNASKSVYIVSEGTKKSYRLAKGIHEGSSSGADKIKKFSRENSKLLVYRSSDIGKEIVGKSWELSKGTLNKLDDIQTGTIEGTRWAGRVIDREGVKAGKAFASGSMEMAGDISRASRKRVKSTLAYGSKKFVKGYAAVPSKMKKRAGAMGESLDEADFGGILTEEYERRGRWSEKTTDIMGDTLRNYGKNVTSSFSKVAEEMRGAGTTTGISMATLKSIRWVLQGLFWDATIKPVAKISAASLGYVVVNTVAFPTMVIVREGIATTNVALQVGWNTGKMVYDIVAPSAVAAVAGIYSVADLSASHAVAGTTAVAGGVIGHGGAGLSRVAAVTVKGSGYAAAGVEYVGVPLAAAGIAIGGGTIGTTVGAAGAVTGGTVAVTGEVSALLTEVFGNVISGVTLVGGTAASVAGGAAYGIYEVSKAVVVPAGYEIGGGVVLGYGTLSQLGAQSILAVSDASYMVLSLEGPRWVLYAVKGNLGEGDDLPVGTVLDLKKMQDEGEAIYYLPVSDEEMKGVVESVYDNLPEIDGAQKGDK